MYQDILIIKNFIDDEVCNNLNAWVDEAVTKKWLDRGKSRGSSWTYEKRLTTRNYGDRFDYPDVVYQVQDKITNTLKVNDLNKSVAGGGKNGIVVSCTYDGGDVYSHIDPKEEFLDVLRCNILTRKPKSGGHLFINGCEIIIDVGDLHCYLPSTVPHHVTKVSGNISRVLWMFGYQCSKERFSKLFQTQP